MYFIENEYIFNVYYIQNMMRINYFFYVQKRFIFFLYKKLSTQKTHFEIIIIILYAYLNVAIFYFYMQKYILYEIYQL